MGPRRKRWGFLQLQGSTLWCCGAVRTPALRFTPFFSFQDLSHMTQTYSSSCGSAVTRAHRAFSPREGPTVLQHPPPEHRTAAPIGPQTPHRPSDHPIGPQTPPSALRHPPLALRPPPIGPQTPTSAPNPPTGPQPPPSCSSQASQRSLCPQPAHGALRLTPRPTPTPRTPTRPHGAGPFPGPSCTCPALRGGLRGLSSPARRPLASPRR